MPNVRLQKGLEVLRQVDPRAAETLLTRFETISPELARLAIEFGYADVLGRPGLDLPTRELLNVAMLGAMGTASLQLEMHLKSALHVGVSKDQVVEAILQIAVYAGFPAAFNVLLALEKVLAEHAL